VVGYGLRHGVHGIGIGSMAPSGAVFIAVVPVLLYSFVGVELPTAAAEEMKDPRRDIPAAIARAGIAQVLMYGVPLLAILVVLPAGQVTSLHGFIDALATVLTVYGGRIAADGSAALQGAGQVLGWISAAVFIWVLLASGSTWIIGAGRAQSAACLDGAGPAALGRISPRSGVPVRMGLVTGAISLATVATDLYVAGQDGQKYFSAALTVSIALIVVAYLMIFPSFLVIRLRDPGLDRPFLVPGGRPGAWLVTLAATGWSLLATVCLLWPGVGTADPDAALPAGFAGRRAEFELVVSAPLLAAVLCCVAYRVYPTVRGRASRSATPLACGATRDTP
jgi:glutamate:GABA antiporter